jgi:hypothetical protein
MRRTIYLHNDAVTIWTNTRKIETGAGSIGTGFCVQWDETMRPRGQVEANSDIVVTNAHVVDGQNEIFVSKVTNQSVVRRQAHLVAIDYPHDLAILEVEGPAIDPEANGLIVGEYPEIGESVSICGFPLGVHTPRLVAGLISGSTEMLIEGHLVQSLVIQAPVNQGNSGGPVCNAAGDLVGVVYAINPRLKRKLQKPSARAAQEAINYMERALNPIDGFGYIIDPIDLKKMIASRQWIASEGQYQPWNTRAMEIPREEFVDLQRQVAEIDGLPDHLSCIGPFNINLDRTSLCLGFHKHDQWALAPSGTWLKICRSLKEYHFYLKGYTIVAYYKGGPQYRRGIWQDRISLTLT